MGPIGAAIAFIASDLTLSYYVTNRTLAVYKINLSELFYWKKIGLAMLIGVACVPVLLVGELIAVQPLLRACILGVAYLAIYVFLVSRFRVEEVDLLLRNIWELIGRGHRPGRV